MNFVGMHFYTKRYCNRCGEYQVSGIGTIAGQVNSDTFLVAPGLGGGRQPCTLQTLDFFFEESAYFTASPEELELHTQRLDAEHERAHAA